MPLMSALNKIIQREMLIAGRKFSQVVNGWLFFVMTFILFPLCLSPDPLLIKMVSPVIFWVAILFVCLLSVERIFASDFDNGILEQWLLLPYSFTLITLVKLISHWLVSVLPLIVIMPLFALLIGLNWHQSLVLMITMLLATPVILMLCALASAFTLQCGNRGVLMALLVFPAIIPVIIFGAGCLHAAIEGQAVNGLLALLAAILLLAIVSLPFAVSAALRISLDN